MLIGMMLYTLGLVSFGFSCSIGSPDDSLNSLQHKILLMSHTLAIGPFHKLCIESVIFLYKKLLFIFQLYVNFHQTNKLFIRYKNQDLKFIFSSRKSRTYLFKFYIPILV